MPEGPSIQLSGVSHAFVRSGAPPLPVLDGIDLEIASGEIVAIVGPSGSGKSTLVDIVAGRLRPTQGGIVYGDGQASRTVRLGVVFQEPALLPWRTVHENVRLPLELLDEPADADERAMRAIRLVQIEAFASAPPRELSVGMGSRAAIARALVTDPNLLLLDESFGSLDEVTAEMLMIDLSQLLRRLRSTVILVTHSLEQAVFLADRVFLLGPPPAKIAGVLCVEEAQPRAAEFLRSEAFLRKVLELRALMRDIRA